MPDLQSELSKIANAWHDDTPTQTQPDSNTPQEKQMQATPVQDATTTAPMPTPATRTYNGYNRIQELFYYIKSHGMQLTKDEAVRAMTDRGHHYGTASANVSVLINSGLVRLTEGHKLFAYYPEYDAAKITKYQTMASKRAKERAKEKELKAKEKSKEKNKEKTPFIPVGRKSLGELLREKLSQPDAVANTYVQPVMPMLTPTHTFDAEAYVNQHLTITQAKTMFNYLKTVFGN